MRHAARFVPAWVLLGLAAPSQAQDARDRVHVEVLSPKREYYLRELLVLRIRIAVQDEFLRDNLLQPFRRRLDVPVRVEAEWWNGLPGALAVADEAASSESGNAGPSFVLNDSLTSGTKMTDPGRPAFTIAEIERSFFAESAGELVIPAPKLAMTYATRFRDDFIEGRVPVDRQEVVVEGEPLVLEIRPLPETGRPPEFGGAVGRFTVRAEAEPREVRVGQSFKLVIEIEGEGDLAQITPPRLEALAAFHVYGVVEDLGRDRRQWTYDVAPLRASVSAVPAIPFAFFDPTPPATYRTVRTRPIPLVVRPAAAGEGVPPPGGRTAPEAVVLDIHDPMPLTPDGAGRGGGGIATPTLVLALLLPWLLAAGLWSWLRIRARAPRGAQAAIRGAAHRFHREAATRNVDLATALADYLATRLQCPRAAVVAPELAARLRAGGVGGELAERTATLLDDLLEARFGGRLPDDATGRAVALVAALEHDFTAAEAG